MSDPFHILPETDGARTWDEAVREAVARFQASAERFEQLYEQVDEEDFTEDEWRVIDQAALELEEYAERAEEGYVAVQYDSNAWYRVMEYLEKLHLRLESAMGVIERVLERKQGEEPASAG